MKPVKTLTICFLVLGFLACSVQSTIAEQMGTAFTYQGRLIDNNQPADDLYDFQFKLFDGDADGNRLGTDVNKSEVDVIDGYFIVELDFGGDVFDGNAVWLEVGVRPGDQNDPNIYTVLLPRQEISVVPYALQTRGIFVDDAGNVGIGTTSPSERLKVIGTVKSTGGFATGDTATLQNGWIRVYNLIPNDLIFKVGGTGPPASPTQGTEIMRLTETGRLGIGTNSPATKLDVAGIITATDGNSDKWNTAFGWGNHALAGYLTEIPSDVMRENENISLLHNDVGYITSYTETDPTVTLAKLQALVSNDFHQLGGIDQDTHPSDAEIAAMGYIKSYTETDPQVEMNSPGYVPKWDGSALVTGTIYDNGNVGIGTTVPGAKLVIHGSDVSLGIGDESGTGASPSGIQFLDAEGKHVGLRFDGTKLIYEDASATRVPSTWYYNTTADFIVRNGKVGIGTLNPGSFKLYVNGTAYSTGGFQSSDLLFKQNIRTIDSPIDKIKNIKGVSFEWKTSEYKDKGFPEGRHYGVVAQEVAQTLPEIVKEGPDGEKAVSYTELIPILTEAIKEQQKQIESLQSKVKTLRETIEQQQLDVAKEVQK